MLTKGKGEMFTGGKQSRGPSTGRLVNLIFSLPVLIDDENATEQQ
jgi:hypothetical protein